MRVTSSRVVYENRWMRVHEDRTELPDGTPGLYGWVEKPPAAVIVPLEPGRRLARPAVPPPVGERFWEFPQGAWEQAPDADAEALARGELAEETGLRAARLEHLGRLYFAYGLTDQYADVWRATGLEPGAQALEPTEYGLVARRFERTEVERMIREQRDPRRGLRRRVASRDASITRAAALAAAHLLLDPLDALVARAGGDGLLARVLLDRPRSPRWLRARRGPSRAVHRRTAARTACPGRR